MSLWGNLVGVFVPTYVIDRIFKVETAIDETKKTAQNAQTTADKKVAKSNGIAALPLAGWVENTQTVEVAGVTAYNTIVVGADPANYTEYADANVRCTEQGEGTLTFVCDDVPEIDLNANVMILT